MLTSITDNILQRIKQHSKQYITANSLQKNKQHIKHIKINM